MGIRKWWNSGSQSVRLGQSYMQSNDDIRTQEQGTGWRKLWRKVKRDQFSHPVSQQASYDPSTYPKNFDQGAVWSEPDNLSRSFSARFADPNKIFPKPLSLLDWCSTNLEDSTFVVCIVNWTLLIGMETHSTSWCFFFGKRGLVGVFNFNFSFNTLKLPFSFFLFSF